MRIMKIHLDAHFVCFCFVYSSILVACTVACTWAITSVYFVFTNIKQRACNEISRFRVCFALQTPNNGLPILLSPKQTNKWKYSHRTIPATRKNARKKEIY